MKKTMTMGHFAGHTSCCGNKGSAANAISRRNFVKVTGAVTMCSLGLSGLSWTALTRDKNDFLNSLGREPLIVKPILTYELPVRKEQTSWRNWGGIQTEIDVLEESKRISLEINTLKDRADFPVKFLKVDKIRNAEELNNLTDLESADVYLVYAAGGGMDIFDVLNKKGGQVLFFCRHKSGPVYLWYEIISPRFLRQHTDRLAVTGIDENDVIIDNQDEVLWRLRALGGLKNTLNTTIVAIGGPDAWAQPPGVVPKLVQDKFRLNVKTLSYDELGKVIIQAKSDKLLVARSEERARLYQRESGIKMETKSEFVLNCFILAEVFTRILETNNCRAITVNQCMGTIMPLAGTSACLTLSLLNDAGYLAFCESDFVAIPTGILLGNIAGKPVFLNDPTYPHDNLITLAHCTAPRKMDGKRAEPARIRTHFESDYGAAPKVEMLVGQIVTNIMPDFAFKKNIGLLGTIVDNPDLDICRSQIDVNFECDSKTVAEQMPGFHWVTVYGNYIRETGYALKKLGIEFLNLA